MRGAPRSGLLKKHATENVVGRPPFLGVVPLLNRRFLPTLQIGKEVFQPQRQTGRTAIDIDAHALSVGFAKNMCT